MIDEFHFWYIWNRDIFFFHLEYNSLCSDSVFCCIFWEEKILYNKRKSESVEKYEKNTRIHNKERENLVAKKIEKSKRRYFYSPIMMLERAIWFPAMRCLLHLRRDSRETTDGWTISSRGRRLHFPLRVVFSGRLRFPFFSASKESRTLEISSSPSRAMAVSFWSLLIWACVSDIFEYNTPAL